MSDFRPYIVQAKLGGMSLRVLEVSRRYSWSTSKHGTPGTDGENIKKHGRESITDSVTCLLTVPEVEQILGIANRHRVTWTHPLLRSIDGTVESLDIPAVVDTWGFFRTTFSFIESNDPAIQTNDEPRRSVPSSRAKLDAMFGQLAANMDTVGPIPTPDGSAFDAAFDAFAEQRAVVDTAMGEITEGAATWQDLSRELDALIATAGAFVESAQAVEATLGGLADTIQTAPALMVQTVRETVDSVKSAAGTVASLITQGPSDLFLMMQDAAVSITEDNIIAIMEDNLIFDPFAIPAGVTITIPVAT
jgi:hypothetical protein